MARWLIRFRSEKVQDSENEYHSVIRYLEERLHRHQISYFKEPSSFFQNQSQNNDPVLLYVSKGFRVNNTYAKQISFKGKLGRIDEHPEFHQFQDSITHKNASYTYAKTLEMWFFVVKEMVEINPPFLVNYPNRGDYNKLQGTIIKNGDHFPEFAHLY